MSWKKLLDHLFRKYVNGTKGVISLFLAILMVPFVTIAGALINAGRINSAVAVFDEALCNASNSTLGSYDSFLRKRFGLMAMGQDTSGGGTKYGNTSAGYSADDLVNDLFQYYMEQNLNVLSNTYTDAEVDATGLYPLSDSSVLLASVLESSKYTVPARLTIDWLSLDDLLSSLTKGLSTVSSVESLISSGTTVITDVEVIKEKKESFETEIDDCNTARDEFNTAYNDLVEKTDDFNDLLDIIVSKSQDVQTYSASVNNAKTEKENAEEDLKEAQDKIKTLQEDTDSAGNPVDHKAEINELQELIDGTDDEPGLQEVFDNKDSALTTANTNLSNAEAELATYQNQFSEKRDALITAIDTYYDKTVALRDAISSTGDAAVGFQSACSSLASDSISLAGDMASTGIDLAKDSNNKTKDELNSDNELYRLNETLADYADSTEYANEYHNMQQENISAISQLDAENVSLSNKKTVFVDGTKNAASDYYGEMSDFAERGLTGEYATIYQELENLRLHLANQVKPSVPTSYDGAHVSYSGCYYSVVNPIEKEYAEDLIENFQESAANAPIWVTIKAVLSFIKTILNLSVFYDPELTATVSAGYYSENGGLPSTINRTDHPLTSSYDSSDAELSNYYKSVLNSYSASDVYADVSDMSSVFDEMMGYVDTILNCMDPFYIWNIGELFSAVGNLFGLILRNNFSSIIESGIDVIKSRFLLVGYISYNTANRTTYTGKALTGASFSLPGRSSNTGYVFSGAETEYIFNGSMNEKDNQVSVFQSIQFTRLLFDAMAIIKDETVNTLAGALGAILPVIGNLIVYAIYFLLESLIDTIILVNGGEIPLIKTYVFLSPAGIPKLIESLTNITLDAATKQRIYSDAVESFSQYDDVKLNVDSNKSFMQDAVVYKDPSKVSGTTPFTINYTKTLQLLLVLGKSTSHMLARLADIIQMEASYNASKGIAAYGFNLDKSYTYLRASGSFQTNEFLPISEQMRLSSKQRIVYQGY